MNRLATVLLPLIALAGYAQQKPQKSPLPELPTDAGRASSRVSGSAGAPTAAPPPEFSSAPAIDVSLRQICAAVSDGGNIMLDFADTDNREIVNQILDASLG